MFPETVKGLLNQLALLFVVAVSLGLAAAVVVLLFHLLAPVSYHFLSASQIGLVQSALLGGAAVGIAQKYLKKHT
ncbi:hypothetical protein [Marinobacter sp. CA1]|uniref:hypothetical protein n=1 Tax=Marinobacter sp. CA1 TaxID=2817656 RepID=UPI001D087284|nr:hypothetical protein [Marinobacter sp. CA1]UDL03981.1 hypothetical protein J2887_14830 [Marinobacter sp. CA1]